MVSKYYFFVVCWSIVQYWLILLPLLVNLPYCKWNNIWNYLFFCFQLVEFNWIQFLFCSKTFTDYKLTNLKSIFSNKRKFSLFSLFVTCLNFMASVSLRTETAFQNLYFLADWWFLWSIYFWCIVILKLAVESWFIFKVNLSLKKTKYRITSFFM